MSLSNEHCTKILVPHTNLLTAVCGDKGKGEKPKKPKQDKAAKAAPVRHTHTHTHTHTQDKACLWATVAFSHEKKSLHVMCQYHVELSCFFSLGFKLLRVYEVSA